MISTKPRLYQEKILAECVRANTLVVLPTGLGKTLIAVMLGLIRQKTGKILILAPTKPLVEQHAKTIKAQTGIEPVTILGTTSPEHRKGLWKNSNWFVATPQSVQSDLLRDSVKLNNFSLIVFDEAHRATGNYAYVYLARKFTEQSKSPLILALTASPGTDTAGIQEIVDNLYIKQIETRSENDSDVRPYVKEKQIQWIKTSLPAEYKLVISNAKKVVGEYLRFLKKTGYLKSADLSKIRKKTLLGLQDKVTDDPNAMSALAGSIKGLHALELLGTQSMQAYGRFIDRMRKDKTRAGRELAGRLPTPIKLAHPKTKLVVKYLTGIKQAILFAHYRDQVEELIELLDQAGISAKRFGGQKGGMTQKKQKQTIEAFRNHEFSVLIATSVAEEGIDIPSVDRVVFYEPVPSAIRHIQRKGRLRKGGKVLILATIGTREDALFYATRAKEKRMASAIAGVKPSAKSQITLGSFSDKGPFIIADDRELEVARLLKSVKIKRITIGDFVISDRMVVERKTAADFVNSIVDGRLFQQLAELKEAYDKPVILIEGYNLFGHRAVHPNAIRGALASLISNWEIPVVFTASPEDTARFLEALSKREHGEARKPSIKMAKAATLDKMQERLVASLPGINLTLVRRLFDKFGSPASVFAASIDELKSVEGVGAKKAEKIRQVLNSPYTKTV
ncbi:MAG: DEAD/DEAH box helicase [Candidatus Altiarchaeota archaeon]|nr:DEAD/DEAH box helicase [Candidatus Altiarchaeota archaeon]